MLTRLNRLERLKRNQELQVGAVSRLETFCPEIHLRLGKCCWFITTIACIPHRSFGKQKIRFHNLTSQRWPLSSSWCISYLRLVFSLSACTLCMYMGGVALFCLKFYTTPWCFVCSPLGFKWFCDWASQQASLSHLYFLGLNTGPSGWNPLRGDKTESSKSQSSWGRDW